MLKTHYGINRGVLTVIVILTTIMLTACSEDEDNIPSMADTDRMEQLVDHDNAYIENFKQKYGTYILYDFDDLIDFAYQFEEASAWREAIVTHLKKADVPAAIAFLKGFGNGSAFLDCYSDDLLKTLFPRKLLLCAKIESSQNLGLSIPVDGIHTAVANMNSMSIARLDAASLASIDTESERKQYFQQLNYIFLAAYLVNSRNDLFVDKTFFEYSKAYYGTLIDENRKQASAFQKTGDPDKDATGFYAKFYDRGLFYPLGGDEETYYDSRTNDLISYIHEFVFMDEATAKELKNFEMMSEKVRILAQSLREIGVDIEKVNPVATENFGNE